VRCEERVVDCGYQAHTILSSLFQRLVRWSEPLQTKVSFFLANSRYHHDLSSLKIIQRLQPGVQECRSLYEY
jgi:hypothetical protein